MGTLDLALSPTTAAELPPGLPRRLLRRLIVGRGLGVGSRVLVAGPHPDALVQFLDRLGLVVCGSRFAGNPRLHSADALASEPGNLMCDESLDMDESGWDLVVGWDLPAHDGSLNSAAALHATAELLACARPGGHAALLVRSCGSGFAAAGHAPSCFARHLSHFSGTFFVNEFSDGLVPVDPLAWIVGRRPRPGCLLAGVCLPLDALSSFGWHDQAERSVQPDDCCRLKATRRSAA